MKKVVYELDIRTARALLELLAKDQYSPLWRMVDDFIVNGHYISVKGSTQFHHIVIDDIYQNIGPVGLMHAQGKNYKFLDYVMELITREEGIFKVGKVVELARYDWSKEAAVGEKGIVADIADDATVTIEWNNGNRAPGYDVTYFRKV